MIHYLMTFAVGLVTLVGAKELTSETWATETAGKSVFIKFLAPW